MARFFFDLTDGTVVLTDEEGVEARDLDNARLSAVEAAREMRRSGELEDTDDRWSLIIRDERGKRVETIRLGDISI